MDNADFLPHWFEHASSYWVIFQITVQGIATWLVTWIPTPPEFGGPRYKVFYGIVERLGVGKQKPWVNSPSRNPLSDASAADSAKLLGTGPVVGQTDLKEKP